MGVRFDPPLPVFPRSTKTVKALCTLSVCSADVLFCKNLGSTLGYIVLRIFAWLWGYKFVHFPVLSPETRKKIYALGYITKVANKSGVPRHKNKSSFLRTIFSLVECRNIIFQGNLQGDSFKIEIWRMKILIPKIQFHSSEVEVSWELIKARGKIYAVWGNQSGTVLVVMSPWNHFWLLH